MERQNWIDWAKAIGIYLVVLGHCSFTNNDVLGFIFTFHMPLFFMVSGYLFNGKLPETFSQYIIKIKDRLLIPYILINLIVGMWEFVKLVVRGDDGYFMQFYERLYATLLGISGNIFSGPTWFILSLVWCQIFMFAYIKLKEKRMPYYLLLVIPVIIYLINRYCDAPLYFGLSTFPLALLYFLPMYHFKHKILNILTYGGGGGTTYQLAFYCL